MALRVLHLLPPGVLESEYFQGIQHWHDPGRVEVRFATLGGDEKVVRGSYGSPLDARGLGFTRRRQFLRAVARLRARLRSEKIDILHTHLHWPSLVGLAAARAARTPIVLQTRHYSDVVRRMGKATKGRLHAFAAQRVDHNIANSEYTRHVLVTQEDVPADRVETVHLGFNFDRFKPTGDRDSHRRRLAPGADFIVGSVGRLVPLKGYDLALAAFADFHKTRPKSRYLLRGDGPEEDRLRKLASELGLADAVQFLPQLPIADLVTFYESLDVFLHPSLSEGFGQSVVEAMALGVPPVAFDAGPMPEIVETDEMGLLVAEGDPRALTTAMKALAEHPATARRIGAGARSSVLRRFPIRQMVMKHERIYERLWAERGEA